MFLISQKVTRARPTSNMMFSAAAIAVVSEVNPDEPGAFLFPALIQKIIISQLFYPISAFFSLSALFITTPVQAVPQKHTAVDNAVYNNTLVQLTPMLFHHIELGMNYEAVMNMVGKPALYCDSGESTCNASNGVISKTCLNTEFIQANKTWICHWDGVQSNQNAHSSLDVWFVGIRAVQVAATMPNGNIYRRDSGNTIQLERH